MAVLGRVTTTFQFCAALVGAARTIGIPVGGWRCAGTDALVPLFLVLTIITRTAANTTHPAMN